MKNLGKKLMTSALALSLTCTMGTTVFAASNAEYTKNENVYVRLEQNGEVRGTYVVNSFDVTKEGEITDYGDYDRVQNLTNLDALESDKDEHTFVASKGKFYYQGDIDKAELPWNFDIIYTLDGEEVEKDTLAGQEGELEIHMEVRKNPAFTDETLFQSYMLQASFTLDPELCDNIQAEGATISDAGANENVTFIVNPGTEADLVITTDVENFEMDDISINAAAAIPTPVSYVSDQNNTEKTTFIISAEGVTIPEPKVEEVIIDEPSFMDKIADLFNGLFD